MELKGKRILVTGGAGFIGSHICERLLQEGCEIIVLDNLSTGKLSNLENIKDKIKFLKGNIENYEDVNKAIQGCDFVIHEAFPYAKSGMGLEQQHLEDGILGTYNILKASVKNKIKKVVNVSSVAAYGIQDQALVKEDTPIKVFLPYGVTKHAAELYCEAFSKIYGLDTISLRYFYVYGERYAQFDHSALIIFLNNIVKNKPITIYGDGSQIRDYTYISDVVDGTLLALKKEKSNGEVYNISNGQGLKILDLAKKVIEISGRKVGIRFAEDSEQRYSDEYCKIPIGVTTKKDNKWIDERNYLGDISKARKDLNYNPKVSLDEGIKRTLNWIQNIKK